MKKFTLLAGLGLMSIIGLSAQSLTFSQVLLVDNNTATVPAGKVWKVENMATTVGISSSSTTNTSTATPPTSFTYFLNGTEVSCTRFIGGYTSGYNGSSSSQSRAVSGPDRDIFPFWLPAGSSLATGSNVLYFSVVEFNVVP